MRLLAITRGPDAPSARFRFRQYLPQLREAGLDVTERDAPYGTTAPPGTSWQRLGWAVRTAPHVLTAPLAARRYDRVLLQKPLLLLRGTLEPLLPAGYVFDLDDALWQVGPRIDGIARRSGLVVAGNTYIAEHFAPLAPRVEVLPTGVDLHRWQPRARAERPTIVWSGGDRQYPDLALAAPALARVLRDRPEARLRIMSDVPPPSSLGLPAESVEFVRWSPAAEVASIGSAWVGIMPLRDSPWARGKCSYKMLLYMACGVPAVASPVGMNNEVHAAGPGSELATGDDAWIDAVTQFLDDPSASVDAGAAARATVAAHYDATVIGRRLAALLLA